VDQQLVALHNHHTESIYGDYVVLSSPYYQTYLHMDAQKTRGDLDKENVEKVHSLGVHEALLQVVHRVLYTLECAIWNH
jgi:hypothetical protein